MRAHIMKQGSSTLVWFSLVNCTTSLTTNVIIVISPDILIVSEGITVT